MKRQLFFAFTVLLVLGVYVCELQAALVLDQEQNSYDLDGYRPSSGYKVGQSFTTGITGTLKQIDMGFLKTINGDGTVEIFSGEGNQGLLLQTLAVQIYSEDNSQVNYNSFIVDVPIESGQQYSFYFEPNDLTMPDPYYLPFGYPDPYELGVLLVVQNGDPWHNDEIDMVFRTWVETVPEPATTYYVDALNGDDDNDGLSPETAFATIQKGVDSANNGDTVIVAPGTYTGSGNRDIDFYGLAITVRSIDPNDPNIVAATIIDCKGPEDGIHIGFYFWRGEDPNSVLNGLTITKGSDMSRVLKGAIFCSNSNPFIKNCVIKNNDIPGIVCRQAGSPTIVRCRISGNEVGIYVSSESHPTITNCDITDNGGGILCSSSSPTITNCNITDNDEFGGISLLEESSPQITDCFISHNSVSGRGGGIECSYGSHAMITNCTISGNSATGHYSLGGGIYCQDSNTTITNCTISGNSADRKGGGMLTLGGSVTLTNCILWGNTAEDGNQIALYDSSIDVNYCDVEGGQTTIYNDGTSSVIWGEGNIDAAPCFVEPGYWDMNGLWFEGDYHLLAGSPCIDAANDANVYTDIEGNIRPFDFPGVDNNGELPEFDMGAYEAMVSCFGVNHVKLETKAGKKGNKVELKGTFSPALPIDFARDDMIYIIDDGQGHMLSFIIPAGSFEPEGKPEKQKFKFDSPKHSQPDIKAKFDFLKCKFELKVKGVMDTSEIFGDSLAIVLQAGANPANLVEEVVQVEVKPKRLEYKREPKLSCCPKCKGIALLEVTSDQGVFVFEPDPGKEKLKRKTVVDDGVNGRVKIDTSCSKPLEVGDVFGAYTVTDLIKIFDD